MDGAAQSRDGEGIRGFLLLFVVMQGVTFVLDLVALRTVRAAFASETWALGALSPLYRPLVSVEAVTRVVIAFLPVVGFALSFRRSPAAPRFWIAYLLLCVAYGALELFGTRLVAAQFSRALLRRGESTADVERLTTMGTLSGARTIVYGAVWAAYWMHSERVSRTFRRRPRAGDRPATAPPPPR